MLLKHRFYRFLILLALAIPALALCRQAHAEEAVAAGEIDSSHLPVAVDESKSWATLGRLYVVIATDDNLEGVPGQTARANGEAIDALFKKNVAAGAFAVIKVPADQMTRQTIFSLLSNLPLQPQDAVCLYVAGKSGMDRKQGAFFALSQTGEELYRNELRAALARKRCRLNVLVTDACDGAVIPVKPQAEEETTENTDESTAENTARSAAATSPLFFALFFQATGSVDMISAIPYQMSLPTDRGIGCFTESLVTLLEANKYKYLSWYRFFPYLSRGVSLLFESNYPDGAPAPGGMKQPFQTSAILTLGDGIFSPETFAEVYPDGAREFDRAITGITDKEFPLSDDGRKTVTQLVQAAFGLVRPQNDRDKGTHEDYAGLDPDNTVNGLDGTPFSTALASLASSRKPSPKQEDAAPEEKPVETTEKPVETAEKPEKPKEKARFGVQATDNKGDGVRITRVFEGFPGHRAGLEVGDVILSIDGKKITCEKEYSDAVDAAGGVMRVMVRNVKGGNTTTVNVRLRTPQ